MENLATDLFSVLRFLLPGFFAAWVFYGLSAYEKPSQFERVIQALIFTLAVQFLVSIYALIFVDSVDELQLRTPLPIYEETIVAFILAILTGFFISICAKYDFPHLVLRKLRITGESLYPSEWFTAFTDKQTWVVLHFHDERRLYGWPEQWPATSDKGHF